MPSHTITIRMGATGKTCSAPLHSLGTVNFTSTPKWLLHELSNKVAEAVGIKGPKAAPLKRKGFRKSPKRRKNGSFRNPEDCNAAR